MIELEKVKQLPQLEQELFLQKLIRHKYETSLYHLCKYGLGYRDITWITHGDMIRTIENPSKRKLVVMPRGTFKSSISSVGWPISLLNRDPNLRVLLDSELYGNSKNFLREIKMHLQSQRLVSLFGDYYNPSCWNEGEIIIKQRTRVLKEASITASGIGAEKTGQHYDVVICDDLNSPSNSATQEGREKVIQHFRYLTSILEPNGILGVIGTRYAENDVIGFVLRNEMELK